jgi:hypothetical protein
VGLPPTNLSKQRCFGLPGRGPTIARFRTRESKCAGGLAGSTSVSMIGRGGLCVLGGREQRRAHRYTHCTSYSFLSSTRTSTLSPLPSRCSRPGKSVSFLGGHFSFRYSCSFGFGFRWPFVSGVVVVFPGLLVCSHSYSQKAVDSRVLIKYTFCRSPTGPLFQFPLPNLNSRRFLKPSRL